MSSVQRLVAAFVLVGLGSTLASAQAVFGTFSWQMQPYCNSVTLSLIAMPTGFTVEGLDDQCGGSNKASAVGTATFNASGNLTLNFTIGTPAARAVQVTALVSPANGEGTWTDGNGYAGTFRFFGAAGGLPPRPDGYVFFRATSHSSTQSGNRVVFTGVTDNAGGGAYNTTTGVYTVPATGLYSITYSVGYQVSNVTFDRVCAFIQVSNRPSERSSCVPIVGGGGFISLTGATVMPLTAGQTVEVQANTFALVQLLASGSGLTIFKLR